MTDSEKVENENARVSRIFDEMSKNYDRGMGLVERLILGPARHWAAAQARGRVVELAVGTGLNLPLYGPEVEHVVGIDISPRMLELARAKAAADPRVELREGDVQALDLPDASADTVLSTFTFCTVPDPARAAAEAHRVLVPGGRVVLAEHGPSTNRALRALQRGIEPLSIRFGADHLLRDPVPYLTEAGFVVDDVHRTGRMGIVFRVLAHKPA
ncbi:MULTISPECIES: class I SAM-dependent methyltransferase [Rhodococcus]|uniref:class I SAM-dependent methyltransferase n=1 Tax=Rhodococcus TaxID=1827 RepID=UPI000622D069|nr:MULTISPECIES: methyltransferase domain-containing protein [Rhodococcus]AKE89077.1 phospholipid methyltransferase [Rhodococcus aetherivorans]QIX49510.1 class I SAM-dependent methyltransferase [Rhodococcus sp. DMU1]QRI75455.1 methyltransferase domain-containing protein [Rhodococcus aetherivorans]QSE58864.1 methyltransferase domain-containing protein [Rhodococcus sp. PSBB066]QSE69814.1 methyltransferase domain-containing protein [Rhodococcus sp. PSBB049]